MKFYCRGCVILFLFIYRFPRRLCFYHPVTFEMVKKWQKNTLKPRDLIEAFLKESSVVIHTFFFVRESWFKGKKAFQPIVLILQRGNFVYHHLGMSYPLRSLKKYGNKIIPLKLMWIQPYTQNLACHALMKHGLIISFLIKECIRPHSLKYNWGRAPTFKGLHLLAKPCALKWFYFILIIFKAFEHDFP